MDWGLTIANIVLSLLVTVFGYLLVPIIVILKGNKYDDKKLKRINRINCVVVWILFRIIRTAINGEPGTGAAVFLWGAVGQHLLNKYCLEETTEDRADSITSSNLSLSVESEKTLNPNFNSLPVANRYVVSKSELPQIKETPQSTPHKVKPTQVQPSQPPAPSQKRVKYCSRCGKLIDLDTKKCQDCGKQYFRGIPWKIIFNILIPILLGLSIVANTFLYIEMSYLQEEVTSLNKSLEFYKGYNSTLREDKDKYFDLWAESLHEIAFYDQYIVFVADDGSNLYHNYDCKKFQDCTSFWVYGFEGAEDNGYSPCPLCLD